MLHVGQSVTLQRSLDLGSRLAWSAMVRRPLDVSFGASLEIATSFRAASETRSKNHGGQVVEHHGGHAWVHDPGDGGPGAAVSFELPVA